MVFSLAELLFVADIYFVPVVLTYIASISHRLARILTYINLSQPAIPAPHSNPPPAAASPPMGSGWSESAVMTTLAIIKPEAVSATQLLVVNRCVSATKPLVGNRWR